MTYAELLPLIAPHLPAGVPDGLLSIAIQDGCRRFCDDSWYWRKTLVDFDVVADQQDYDLSSYLPENTEIVGIEFVEVDGGAYNPNSFGLYELATLRFVEDKEPTHAYTDGMSVRVVLKPQAVDDALESYVVQQWQEAIRWAVIADLTSMPNKPYTDAGVYSVSEDRYQKQLSKAKQIKITNHVEGDISVSFPSWL